MSVRLGILRGTRSEYQVLWELVLRIVTDPNAIFVISGVRGYRDPFHTSQIWTHLPVNQENHGVQGRGAAVLHIKPIVVTGLPGHQVKVS